MKRPDPIVYVRRARVVPPREEAAVDVAEVAEGRAPSRGFVGLHAAVMGEFRALGEVDDGWRAPVREWRGGTR